MFKSRLLVFTALLIIPFVSCKKDNNNGSDCGPETIHTTIVGTWNETPIFGIGDEVTFSSDLTGSCTDESLFSTEVNGNVSNTFTYTIEGDTILKLDYPNGIGIDYTVKSVECEQLILDFAGITLKLNRKG